VNTKRGEVVRAGNFRNADHSGVNWIAFPRIGSCLRKRVGITAIVVKSATFGFGAVGSLCLFSRLISQLHPYRDLPFMPKSVFVYALLPGFLAAEPFGNKWIQVTAFFLSNVLLYSVAAFILISAFHVFIDE
jgi:hypothetical protein